MSRSFSPLFLTFISYEGAAMIFASGVYVFLFYINALPNAGWMALGVFVTIIAAVVQAAGQAGKSMLWHFDNTGMFHLIRMIGLMLLFVGLRIL